MKNENTLNKHRVIVLTDISSLEGGFKEPDDTQSLVRFLLYTNEFEVEGLVATYTKHWEDIKPEYIKAVIYEYAKVRENLQLHDPEFPHEEQLLSCVKSGNPKCGLDQVGAGKDTEGSDWIISVLDKPDPRLVWILVWGGPTDLAQALWKISSTRSEQEAKDFISKIRVYAIGDQYDTTGQFIKENYKDLFYITSHKTHRGMYRGGNTQLTSCEWLEEHICKNHGSLGEVYPIYNGGDPWGKVYGVKEGDTPSFLYLVKNGLGDPMNPSWGSWGGRFKGNGCHFTDAEDKVLEESSVIATVFRWRDAYQADFQGRMDWCLKSYKEANHPPVSVISSETVLSVLPGTLVKLNASESYDPDGDNIFYSWNIYNEAGSFQGEISITNSNSSEAEFIAPSVDTTAEIHVILTVTDNGTPPLSSYKRVIVKVSPESEI